MPTTINTAQVRQNNMQLLRDALLRAGVGTKITLAETTGLSVATCNNLLQVMLKTGEICEIEPDVPRGGRPAQRFCYNKNHRQILCLAGLSLGEESQLLWEVANAAGEPVVSASMPAEALGTAKLVDIVAPLMQLYPAVGAIGVGVPGLVRDGWVDFCDLPAWQGTDLGGTLAVRFGVPVVVENDMNCAAFGYHKTAGRAPAENTVYMSFPARNCPGCGMVVNGRVFGGATQMAGEVGYLPYGDAPGQLAAHLQNAATRAGAVGHILASTVALVNPAVVTMTGPLLREGDLPAIQAACSVWIPNKHLPLLEYRADYLPDYRQGLVDLTLDRLRYRLG